MSLEYKCIISGCCHSQILLHLLCIQPNPYNHTDLFLLFEVASDVHLQMSSLVTSHIALCFLLFNPAPSNYTDPPLLFSPLRWLLKYSMPPNNVDIPSKHIDRTVGLWHGYDSLSIGMLKSSLPFQSKAHCHGEVGLFGLLLFDGSCIVVERFPFRRVSVPV